VRHRAIDVTRSRSFSKQRIPLDQINFEPRYPDVWQQVDAKLDREQVRRAVKALPEGQKEAVMLAYFGGFTLRWTPSVGQEEG
jgi:RNA polymerase sigma-70 factor, ECF subfamily